jgi:hypothetical protein
VDAPHFCAGAVWEKGADGWRCARAAPIIAWMTTATPQRVHDWLLYKRYKWDWSELEA